MLPGYYIIFTNKTSGIWSSKQPQWPLKVSKLKFLVYLDRGWNIFVRAGFFFNTFMVAGVVGHYQFVDF